ncbi:transposase, partial [Glaesserella parasuis]|nr:transposase [Glaesserella parasuis]MWQ87903.1 transposase [Glaesserella parasuis]
MRTIQRYIEKSPKAKLIPLQQTYLNIISDV